ncbi:aminoglycoside phosphotransferase family protein [Amycolatopsis jejuensis]|uniref:aminoglycoside phosphotransferase family protein n=1 Tax=Amycolatopsis jejuensis TaxID=330084 RepID=UPI000527A1A7|nr:aminoglycoside phosphotransferase family protein [Amycolatopsis jejuensis]
MAVVLIDDAARARLVDRFGPSVEAWCDALPALTAQLCRRWHLTVTEARPGNTGRTLLCHDGAGHLHVLKLCPDRSIATAEATALGSWTGLSRVVQVLDTDLDHGAILLEGLEPGTTLTDRGADVPWPQIGDLLAALHSVRAAGPFPTQLERVRTMYDLAERRLRGTPAENHLPLDLLRTGLARSEALAVGGPTALVHGDLHPGNVLDAGPERGAVAIDPRPCVGDPAFDGVDWAVLPLTEGGTLEEGIAHLPHLDGDRVRAWCIALAPLIAMGPLRREGPTPFTDAVLEMAR